MHPPLLKQGTSVVKTAMKMLRVAGSRGVSGRRRRVRFQPPKVAPEPQRAVAPVSAPMKSADGHWPPGIPAHMVFLHRVNSRIDRHFAPKEDLHFGPPGALEMYEHVFQVQLNNSLPAGPPTVGADAEPPRPSPSQSSDGGVTDEPKTPMDTTEAELVACGRVEQPNLAGSLSSWPADDTGAIHIPPYRDYPPRSSLSEDHPTSAFQCHDRKDDYVDGFSSQSPLSDSIHWHHSFPAVDSSDPNEPNLAGYEERRPSLASSRDMSASPFRSHSASASPHLSDDVHAMNIPRLPPQSQLPMNHGQYAADGVPPIAFTSHGYPHRFHPDHLLHHYTPSYPLVHFDRTHGAQYNQPMDPFSRGLPMHPAYASPPDILQPRPWDTRPDIAGPSAKNYSEIAASAAQTHRAISAEDYHALRPGDILLQPVHTSYHEPGLADRNYVAPGPSADPALIDKSLRPPYWNSQEPSDSIAHGRPGLPSLPMLCYPPPLWLNGPTHCQPYHACPVNGDRASAFPYRPEIERRESWTEHFDLLQSQSRKKRRVQRKDGEKTQEVKGPVYSHQCPLCDRRFPRRNSLAIHLKWHYKDRDGKRASCFFSSGVRLQNAKRSAEPATMGTGLGIFVPPRFSEQTAVASDAPIAATAHATDSNEYTPDPENANDSAANSATPTADPAAHTSRTNVLSISSLLSTNLSATVAAPISPLATPPATPSMKAQGISDTGTPEDPDADPNPDPCPRERKDTTNSENSSASWSDSLFGPDD